MSEQILSQVKDILNSIKHPKTKELIFNLDKINISINNSSLEVVINSSKNEFMLYNSITKELKEKLSLIKNVINVEVKIELEKPLKYKFLNIKKIIVIASGKGGVGKSTIAANIAVELAKTFTVGLLDADIYGPSITQLMGVSLKPESNEKNHFIPLEAHGVRFISAGCFIDNIKNSSFIWRGPMLVKMLYSMLCNTVWGELDYLIIDTPPGTGDIHLSLCENFILDGVILCTTPQMLSITDAQKSANMFTKMNVKIIGIVENMSYFRDKNDSAEYIFGKSNTQNLVEEFSTQLIVQIPLISEITVLSDSGIPVVLKNKKVSEIFQFITRHLQNI